MTLNTNSGVFDRQTEQQDGQSEIPSSVAGSNTDIKTLLSNFAKLNGHILDLSINPVEGSKTLLVSFAEFNERVLDLGMTPQEALDVLRSFSLKESSKSSKNEALITVSSAEEAAIQILTPEGSKELMEAFAKAGGRPLELNN